MSDSDGQEIARRWLAGERMIHIAYDYGVSTETAVNYAHRAGAKTPSRSVRSTQAGETRSENNMLKLGFTREDVEYAIEDGWPTTEIARTFGVSTNWIEKRFPNAKGRGISSLGGRTNRLARRILEDAV